ncbi:MAG: hypothetical protein ACFE8B_14950, partial [Candidatus Hermodarchaeota archaeon]
WAAVRDITGNSTLDQKDIIIDNFLPYIEKVEVRINNSSGPLVHSGEWAWDSINNNLEYSCENYISQTEF